MSRKLVVVGVGVLGIVGNALAGMPVAAGAQWAAVVLLAAWVLAQGVADAGKQGLVRAVRQDRRAMAGCSIAAERTAEGHDVPTWADTVALDPVDAEAAEPRVLNG
jgi:hypothetical protein